MTKDEALKLALEALEQSQTKAPFGKSGVVYWEGVKIHEAAITAIKAALAQPAQKDAARYQHIKGMARAMSLDMGGNHYWHMSLRDIRGPNLDEAIDRAIEAELKEKNT
jgi:hypothetical protein